MKKLWYLDSPIGRIGLAEDGGGITDLFLRSPKADGFQEEGTPLLRRAAEQLREYFSGQRKKFDLPLSLHGTPFQLADWAALQTIPYGETRSYAQIAAQRRSGTGKPAAPTANGRNPVMILVPCHRVVAADGGLGGFSAGTEIKRFLLKLEEKHR